jgi:hypothetical protein
MTASLRSCLCLIAVLVASFATAQDLELKVTIVTPSSVVDSAVVTVLAKQVIIVGDDKQISPTVVGVAETEIRSECSSVLSGAACSHSGGCFCWRTSSI